MKFTEIALAVLFVLSGYLAFKNFNIEMKTTILEEKMILVEKQLGDLKSHIQSLASIEGQENSPDKITDSDLLVRGKFYPYDEILNKKDSFSFCDSIYLINFGPKKTIEVFQRLKTKILKIYGGKYNTFSGLEGITQDDYFNNDEFWKLWGSKFKIISKAKGPEQLDQIEFLEGKKFLKSNCP